jgi:hypothetical protein
VDFFLSVCLALISSAKVIEGNISGIRSVPDPGNTGMLLAIAFGAIAFGFIFNTPAPRPEAFRKLQ